MTDAADRDPVLASRARYRRGAGYLQRLGYALYLVAIVGFFVGLVTSFSGPVVTVVVVALIAGSIILAVGIQVMYAIRGAERHEEESTAQRRHP